MDIINEYSAAMIRFQIIDSAGLPAPVGAVVGIHLTVFNKLDGNVILEETSVKNANNGTYTETLEISAISQADPVVITTTTPHNLRTGDKVFLSGIEGPDDLNDRAFLIEKVSETKFALMGENGRSYDAYESGGTVRIALFEYLMSEEQNPIVGNVRVGEKEEHVASFRIVAGGGVVHRPVNFKVRALEHVSATTTTT